MPKSSSLAKRFLGIMEKQEQVLRQLERLTPQRNEDGKPEGEDLVATIWSDTLETLETAIETIEDLAWAADPDGMAKETCRIKAVGCHATHSVPPPPYN